MKRLMIIVSVAIFAASPLYGQGVYTRDVKVGATRTTEIAPSLAQTSEKPTAPQTGDPKAGKANGQVVPAVGKAADSKNPPSAIRDSQTELGAAIRSLNPSYAIAPVIGNSSASGGSYYIRSNAYPYQYSNAYGTTTWLAAPPLGLPPPVYLGGGRYPYYGYGYGSYPYSWNTYPYSWLYSGTVRLDVAPGEPIDLAVGRDARTNELEELRKEVHKLRKLVEKMSERDR